MHSEPDPEPRRRGRGGHVELLTSLWASDEDALVYVAGERAQPLRRRHEIAQYYRDAVGTVETVEIAEVTDLLVDAADDRARASFAFRFAGREAAGGARFDVTIRVTMLARRDDDRWLLTRYHESSPGPV